MRPRRPPNEVLTQYEEMRTKIGTKQPDFDPAKEEISSQFKKTNDRFDKLVESANAVIQKAGTAGAGPEIQEIRDRIQQIVQSYRSESSKTYSSSLDRITELMENLSLLSTELSANYQDLRQKLESATNVAKQQVDVQAKAADASRADLDAEHKKHEDERQILVNKVGEQQTEIDKKLTEVANLQAKLKQFQDDYTREKDTLTSIIRELKDRVERQETILDHPDGYITFVDYERGEVQLNINKAMGARPQMVMSIFDARAPGIPTEKPKGTIELTKIGDQFSVARIVKTMNPDRSDPDRRHRLFGRLVAQQSDAVRPDRQDRREPRRPGRSRGAQADDPGIRRRRRFRPARPSRSARRRVNSRPGSIGMSSTIGCRITRSTIRGPHP